MTNIGIIGAFAVLIHGLISLEGRRINFLLISLFGSFIIGFILGIAIGFNPDESADLTFWVYILIGSITQMSLKNKKGPFNKFLSEI